MVKQYLSTGRKDEQNRETTSSQMFATESKLSMSTENTDYKFVMWLFTWVDDFVKRMWVRSARMETVVAVDEIRHALCTLVPDLIGWHHQLTATAAARQTHNRHHHRCTQHPVTWWKQLIQMSFRPETTPHCVSEKTTLMLHTITSTHINRFQ